MMLNIAPALYGQTDKYIQVWLYLFAHIDKGNNFHVQDVMFICKISRVRLYDILKRGVVVFKQNNIDVNIIRKNKTDGYFKVEIKQLEVNKTSEIKHDIKQDEKQEKQTKKLSAVQNEIALAQRDTRKEVTNIVITYLNEKANKHYRVDSDKTIKLIGAKLNDGYTIEQMQYVIDVKTSQWMNTDMEKYIRPETLFGNKFENYLNDKINNKPTNISEQRIRSAEETIDLDWGFLSERDGQ
jgi:uncharacterized phage protein (TIGR02220 family)